MTRFQLHVTECPGRAVLSLEGELDYVTEISFSVACADLLRRQHNRIVIDAGCLTFCDCSGLTAMLDAQREAERQGGYVRLIGVRGALARLLTLTGLVDRFPPYADLRQASR